MALTRTLFQSTPADRTPATVTSARQQTIQRVSNQIARRALAQVEAAQTQANAPALAAPGGLVQRPGGEPLRPRATQGTGATPVGSPVQFNQGIATGQPVLGGGGPQVQGWNGEEVQPVAIDLPEVGRVYVASAEEFYRSQVVKVATSEPCDVVVLPEPGQVAEVGDRITLEFLELPGAPETITVNILLRRLL